MKIKVILDILKTDKEYQEKFNKLKRIISCYNIINNVACNIKGEPLKISDVDSTNTISVINHERLLKAQQEFKNLEEEYNNWIEEVVKED